MHRIFGTLHHWCYVSAPLVCYALAYFGVHNRWCATTLVNYILVAIYLWCNVSSVHCIFGVIYMHMHFWCAMHRQLWWCLVGVITIVQCIFGALFLGLGCNIFLVLRLWCYAFSAISRRLATAVAHLFYLFIYFILLLILFIYFILLYIILYMYFDISW